MNLSLYPFLPFLLAGPLLSHTRHLVFAHGSQLDLAFLCIGQWWPTHMFSFVLLNWYKLLFDLWQAFSLSSNIMPSTLDWSLSALRSLSSLLLPHKSPRNLFRPHSSFRALFVSRSNASAVATLMSLSLSHSLQTLMAVVLNFFLTACALSSSTFKACTSSLSSGVSASSSLEIFSFGSQDISCVLAFNHLW